MEKNGKWRQKIRGINLTYLNIARQMGGSREGREYAYGALGLDDDRLKLLMSLDMAEVHKIADIGALLFRLKLPDLKSVQSLCKKGNGDRATRLMTAALKADSAKEGEA